MICNNKGTECVLYLEKLIISNKLVPLHCFLRAKETLCGTYKTERLYIKSMCIEPELNENKNKDCDHFIDKKIFNTTVKSIVDNFLKVINNNAMAQLLIELAINEPKIKTRQDRNTESIEIMRNNLNNRSLNDFKTI